MRKWYRFEAKAEESVADLYIYDDIGKSFWDDDTVTAKQFIADLKALPAGVTALNVHINSYGGDVFEAVAIANALREQKAKGRTVTTMIDGIAASAATIVAMAGETIQIADNGMVFVHDPWGCICGNAAEMRKTADDFDAIRDAIVTTYQWHSELSAEELQALMAAETMMDADEAIAKGFATEKVEGLKAAASLSRESRALLGLPEKVRAKAYGLLKPVEAPAPAPVAANAIEVMRLCREAGCLDLAEGLVAANATVETVTAEVAKAKAAKTEAEARAKEITAICATAKLPELASGYINGGMPIADIKAHIVTLTAKLSGTDIDPSLDPNRGTSTAGSWKNAFAKAKSHGLTRH